MPTRVMLVGLGPIGAGVARQLNARRNFKLVAAVDVDPAKVGRDLADVVDLGKRTRVTVSEDPVAAIRKVRPDVAVVCTSSSLKKVWPLMETIVKRKVPIVSTTEELSYPYFSNRALARKIDAAARKAKVAVVGTGVNPGFAMDALPIALTAVCERVDAIRVERVQDARIRRLPFQRKIGAGLTVDEFAERVKAGTVRHVGLAESVAMIGDAMGWKIGRVTDEIHPMIAAAVVKSRFLRVDAGHVCGIVQDGVGYSDGKPSSPSTWKPTWRRRKLRLGADRGIASALRQGAGRLPRRRVHHVHHRQHDSQSPRGLSGTPHDEKLGAAVLRRRQVTPEKREESPPAPASGGSQKASRRAPPRPES